MQSLAYFNRDNRSGGGSRGGFRRDNFRGRGDRQMFDAICSNCGKACQVPFRPTGEKPVYCSDCFEKMGGRNENRRSEGGSNDRPRFENRAPRVDTQFKVQLDSLNTKLDKIISLLQPKVESSAATPLVVVGEPKVPKEKKVTKKKASVKKE